MVDHDLSHAHIFSKAYKIYSNFKLISLTNCKVLLFVSDELIS